MSNKVKDIDIKTPHANDIINIKNLDVNNTKINEKSYQNIG